MDPVTLTDEERGELHVLLGDVRFGTNSAVQAWAERVITARLEAKSRADFLASMPPPDDGYHHWHTRAGMKSSPSCGVCQAQMQVAAEAPAKFKQFGS